MSKIKSLLSATLLSALISSASVSAEEGVLNCTSLPSKDIETIVVYLNGIDNDLEAARKGREALANALGGRCDPSDCLVEKFWNKTDGFFDDFNELSFVGGLEGASSNLSMYDLVRRIERDYAHLLKSNPGKISNNAKELDQGLLNALKGIKSDSKNNNDESVFEFSSYGNNVSKWLKSELLARSKTFDKGRSTLLGLIEHHGYQYNVRFNESYNDYLRTLYLSNRKIYGLNNEAAAAITRTVESLTTYLEEHILGGKKVVVVAHSQGNHIIELANSLLRKKHSDSVMESLQVVGVGSVASTTPSASYVTWDNDSVVLGMYDATTDGDPLTGNFATTDNEPADGTNNHNFADVYLNDRLKGRYVPQDGGNYSQIGDLVNGGGEYSLRDLVVGLVSSGIEAAKPIPDAIDSTGILTTTLRWEQYDDMDLHTNENDENTVSFRHKGGLYGNLDLDDTDGEGPEHYTVNLECKDLANKKFTFGMHQYRNGGYPAVAHMSIKVGNSSLLHRSFVRSKWPSDAVWVGKVEFGELKNDSLIDYSVSIRAY